MLFQTTRSSRSLCFLLAASISQITSSVRSYSSADRPVDLPVRGLDAAGEHGRLPGSGPVEERAVCRPCIPKNSESSPESLGTLQST
jgi:hypothetical protein